MTVTISHLAPPDHAAVARLLDAAVGTGFWSLDDAEESLSFVARDDGLAGVILDSLEPARLAFPEEPATPEIDPDAPVLHIRELAVAPGHRRAGVATRLVRRAEAAGRTRGASLIVVYAWLPAGRPEPDSVPFYLANDYVARHELPGFYGPSSVQRDAVCPYCGDPPCRCAARIFVKDLAPSV